jgi:hypothetical protein
MIFVDEVYGWGDNNDDSLYPRPPRDDDEREMVKMAHGD